MAALFLYISGQLVDDLAARERERMEIWADATKEIVSQLEADADTTVAGMHGTDINFLLRIIEGNTTIPVLLTDDRGNILNHRNFDLPDPVDPLQPMHLSAANRAYLEHTLTRLKGTHNVIPIAVAPGLQQKLYYEDSTVLRRLRYFPYVQLFVMMVFLLVVYLAVLQSKKAEQNKVWVGLSKETAHQLGTPISSLMAWMELLPDMGVDADTCAEMNKDVQRLSTIASRFSKIGSTPDMQPDDVNAIVQRAASYMASRISSRIRLTVTTCPQPLPVRLSAPLFEWVMENLIKNAVDAMQGSGTIDVRTFAEQSRAIIEVTDSGKGIPRKNFKKVFQPGYTTKKRGWGLGLTLAKRIISQYHRGRIFVRASQPGCTVFRIELPLSTSVKKIVK